METERWTVWSERGTDLLGQVIVDYEDPFRDQFSV